MPWTIDDHEASAVEAIERGVISGDPEHLADVSEPTQSAEHQARVSSLSILNQLAGPDSVIDTPWQPPVVPPVDPPTEPEYDLIVNPSTPRLADTVYDAGPGSHVKFLPGVYNDLSLVAVNGQYLYGVGAILDGGIYAVSGEASGDTYHGFDIRNYQNPWQEGAVHLVGGIDRTVTKCDVHDNNGIGIRAVADHVRIADCLIHHQHQLGVSIDGADGIVEDCRISFNNWLQEVEWGWEGGGSKFWETTNLVLRRNHVHDNHGPGLWCDHGNTNTLYENNIVEDNFSSGIFHEISTTCTIRNNTVRNNGHGWDGWLWGAGIQIANAGLADIYDNILVGNKNAICFTDQGRGYGPLSGDVYGNTVTASGIVGVASDQASDPVGPFSFRDNHYTDTQFAYGGGVISAEEWLTYFPGDAT